MRHLLLPTAVLYYEIGLLRAYTRWHAYLKTHEKRTLVYLVQRSIDQKSDIGLIYIIERIGKNGGLLRFLDQAQLFICVIVAQSFPALCAVSALQLLGFTGIIVG